MFPISTNANHTAHWNHRSRACARVLRTRAPCGALRLSGADTIFRSLAMARQHRPRNVRIRRPDAFRDQTQHRSDRCHRRVRPAIYDVQLLDTAHGRNTYRHAVDERCSIPRHDGPHVDSVRLDRPLVDGAAASIRRHTTGFVALFFAPFLNLVFFAVLCFVPNRESINVVADGQLTTRTPSKLIPTDPLGSAATGAILTGLVGSLAVYLGVQSIGVYGWGVFVALPFCMGMASVLIHTYHRPQTLASCLLVSVVSVLVVGIVLFALAVEGLICIMMAVPVATPLAMLGGLFGFLLQRNKHVVPQGSMMCVLAILPLTLTGLEKVKAIDPPVSIVETSIRIHAPADKVWRNLVAFSDIPPSTDWLFRLGVAQPIRAMIDGNGVGALRRCDFSTGTFVERIEGWEENRYFAFSIVSPAEGMREFSPVQHPSAAPRGILRSSGRRVPPDFECGRNDDADGNKPLPECHVAGTLLAAMVGCDHSSRTRAGFRACEEVIGDRELR